VYITYAEYYITRHVNYSVRQSSSMTFHTNQVLHTFYTLSGKYVCATASLTAIG